MKKMMLVILITVLLVNTMGNPVLVSADNTSYEFLYIGETPVKVGKYYLKCSVKNGRETIYMSKKKKQAYYKTPLTKWLCCNGKQAYYTENGEKEAYLYKLNLSSRKKKSKEAGKRRSAVDNQCSI